jgi:hypothetical protein
MSFLVSVDAPQQGYGLRRGSECLIELHLLVMHK